MDTLARTQLLAKPEIRKALAIVIPTIRAALPAGSFEAREAFALALLEEAGRGTLEEELTELSASLGDEVVVGGVRYRRHLPGVGRYVSLSGRLDIPRDTYRETGVRNGPTVVPLELLAGLVENATPAMAYNIAHGYARCDMRQHGAALAAAGRVPPPRATLERIATQIAQRVVEATPRVEAIVRRREGVPSEARGIVMGLDRTSAPMAEPRAEGAPPGPKKERKRPRVRAVPPPIDVNFRMAYVGTVSLVDEHGEARVTRRYAAPACDAPDALAERMAADIESALRCAPTLAIGCVQDGAPEMWTVTRRALGALEERGVLASWAEAIDRYHLLERLGEALTIIEPRPSQRAARLSAWNACLDASDDAIDEIEEEILVAYGRLSPPQQRALDEHVVYLHNNKDRMRYGALAAASLPIGSGVTESAAKTVINQRAKGSQRWSEPGLRGVLALRAIHQSDRLPAFWKAFSRCRRVAVAHAA